MEAADLLGAVGLLRIFETLLQKGIVPAAADRPERGCDELVVAEAFREVASPLAPGDCLVGEGRAGTHRSEVPVRPGELVARRQLLQQRNCVTSRLLRLGGTARAPEELGEPLERASLFELVAHGPSELELLLGRGDCLVVVIGQGARV